MRVCLVVQMFPALSETFILDHAVSLLEAGHEVHLVASRPSADPEHPDVNRYGLRHRVTYAQPASGGRLGSVPRVIARSLTHPATAWRGLRYSHFGRDVFSLRPLSRILSFRHIPLHPPFDIIHCHYGASGLLGVDLRDSIMHEVPVVTTFHGYDVSRELPRLQRPYRRLFEHGQLLLPVAQHWRQRLLDLGAPPDRTIVHRVGIPLDRFNPEGRIRPLGPLRVLSVARLVEKKGISFGLKAVSSLLERGLELEYTIVGDGPLRSELEDEVSRLRIAEAVKLLGPRTRDEVIQLMKGHDVFLAPSVTAHNGDSEGIPVAAMEAMAMRMPVVASIHSGFPELVTTGVDGLLVPEGDVGGIADALQALNDPSLRRRMSQRARLKIERDHDLHVQTRRLLELYRTISR